MRAARRARIVGDADLAQGRCLEIGPLANPVVGQDVADVRYIDVVDRDGLVAHYAGNPAVDPAAIPEQHFWLTRPDGTVSTLAEAVAGDGPYEHVVASHVIEHVPDMIGWLHDVAQVLTDGGALLLAIPDRRYSFDARRAPATVGQVVQAHLDQDRTPSARAVLDHFMRAVDYSARDAWSGAEPPEHSSHPIEQAQQQLARQQAGAYVDCHVWPLTPRGFADLVDDLLALGEIDFAVERLTATRVGEQEFYATLRLLDANRPQDDVVAGARAALVRLRAGLPDETPTRSDDDEDGAAMVPAHHLADVEQRLAETRDRLVRVRAGRDRARRQRDRALAAVAAPPPDRRGALAGLRQRLSSR